ncbi:MAG: hypothetical protein AAB072_09070, partial [Nitrospirota bacterium]
GFMALVYLILSKAESGGACGAACVLKRLRMRRLSSYLTPQADRFLTDMMPRYAVLVCGPLESHIDSVVIEGHTDDRGGDAMNLRLSQERSFRVMTKGLEVIDRTEPTVSPCFQRLTSASGRGRQDLIAHPATGVDRDKSRRVIFKLRLRSTPTPRTLPHTS